MTHVVENSLLNDHCILKIFEYLNVTDLCQTTQVSKQFRRLSQYTFKHNFNEFKLKRHYKTIDSHELLILFENFAGYIKTLNLNANISLNDTIEMQKLTIELIKKYFIRKKNILNNIKLNNFFFLEVDDALDLYELFYKMDSINIKSTPLPESIPEFITNFTSCKNMRLVRCTTANWPPSSMFFTESHYLPFVSDMEILELKYNEFLHTLQLLGKIDEYFPKLRELTLYSSMYNENRLESIFFSTEILNIPRLPKLEMLDIDLQFHNINPLLRAIKCYANKIHNLSVYHATFDNRSKNYLIDLPNIKQLKLNGICEISTKDIMSMGCYLVNLENLSINLAGNLFMIRQTITNAPKLVKLSILLNTYYTITTDFYDKLLDIVMS